MNAVDAAYAHCEHDHERAGEELLVRHPAAARGPSAWRCRAVYALARRIDDIGDGDLPPAREAGRRSADVRKRARRRRAGAGDDPVLVALADAAAPLPAAAGRVRPARSTAARWTSTGTTYATFDDLVGYCRRVAGSIGRLSLASSARATRVGRPPLADALGVALQITNILRDVVRGLGDGPRLPARARTSTRFGCARRPRGPPDGRAAALVALRGRTRARSGSTAGSGCCRCSTGAAGRAWPPWPASTAGSSGGSRPTRRRCSSGRISLPTWEKAAVAARSLAAG